MSRRMRGVVAMVMALALMVSMMGTAVAVEEVEQSDQAVADSLSEMQQDGQNASDQLETQQTEKEVQSSNQGADASGVQWTDQNGQAIESIVQVADDLYRVDGDLPTTFSARTGVCPTYEEAYQSMIALKTSYPEGMPWTNYLPYGSQGDKGEVYRWNGGSVKGANSGVGCAAFVFILSDEAFGSLPARVLDAGGFTYDDVKVGDILRVNNSHFVIVLQKSPGGVTVAEGNYNKSVHWGRVLSANEVMSTTNFLVTRYPESYVPADDPEADTVMAQGTDSGISWELTKAGTLTVSGNGAIKDYTENDLAPWYAHNSEINTIVIERGVTRIGNYAFYDSNALSVYIPEGVTTVGDAAFAEAKIVAATLPSTVTSIGEKTFYMCPNLVSVSFPEGLKTIGDQAFRGCVTLAYADFPASLTSIGEGAFMSCQAITQVRFKSGDETLMVGDNLFSQSWHLSSVLLPKNLDRISAGMFQSCSMLYSIYIPGSVSEIGDMAFTQCSYLQGGGIYFGGSQATWAAIGGNAALITLQPLQVAVHYDVVYDDPFAVDPDDPGDLVPDEPDGSGHDHVWTATWSYDETHHWHDCTADGCTAENSQKDGYAVHVYGEWVIDVEATASESGSRHRDCTTCDYRQTESIPAIDDSEGSEPGDDGDGSGSGSGSDDSKPGDSDSDGSGSGGSDGSESDGSGSGGTGPDDSKPGDSDSDGSGSGSNSGSGSGSNSGGSSSGGSSSGSGSGSSSGSGSGSSSGSGSNSGSGSGSGNVSGNDKPGAITVNPDGSTSTVVADATTGLTTETTTYLDGTVAKVVTGTNGETEAEVKASSEALDSAQKSDKPYVLPIKDVKVEQDPAMAMSITVLAEGRETVKVAIPVASTAPGVVVMLAQPNGATEVVKTSVVKDGNVVATIPAGATVKVVDNSKKFADVSAADWSSDAVAFVSARGLFSGVTNDSFAPNDKMTRAMLVTVLARFAGVDTASGATWYDKATEWAIAQGISDGANLDSDITREQIVTMLWRLCSEPGAENDVTAGYADAHQISGYAQEAMAWAVENGVMNGFGDGRLDPRGNATRAQVAQILQNFITINSQ